MPRQVQISLPAERTDALLEILEGHDGIVGIQLQRGGSIRPSGDLVSISILNWPLNQLLVRLEREGFLDDPNVSLLTTRPQALIARPHSAVVQRDTSEGLLEETDTNIAHESNMTINALLVMFIAGITAAVGIATGAIHLVIGAMVIAPGFEPLVRISLGGLTRSRVWRRGLYDASAGYGALLLGAVAGSIVMSAWGFNLPAGKDTIVAAAALVEYWSQPTAPSLAVSAVAGVAGAVLIIINRAVLTGGVMIALALVPSLALAGMYLVAMELDKALLAAFRWALDVVLVLLTAFVVILWKRHSTERPRMIE